MERIPAELRDRYKSNFHLADEAIRSGRVEETTRKREARWNDWKEYCGPMGIDPYLQRTSFSDRIRALSGFAQLVREGFYGRGAEVQCSTVNSAITAVGQTIAMVCGTNPTKIEGQDKFLLAIQMQLSGYLMQDPPTDKKLPVEADVPELLVELAYKREENAFAQATADLAMIAFYYLLRIGEYTLKNRKAKGKKNAKRTVQFKLEDVSFFHRDRKGVLRQLPRNASEELIMSAESATLKLDNQKNGWKAACIHQEVNGEEVMCPVRALARRVLHLRRGGASAKTLLCTVYEGGEENYVCAGDISRALKAAAVALHYPSRRGIPIKSVDTHSLRSGGANALALAGYSDTQIQKMGRWRGKTFKDYIRENLDCYSAGMSTSMKKTFKFVNVAGNAFTDITDLCVNTEYGQELRAPAAA